MELLNLSAPVTASSNSHLLIEDLLNTPSSSASNNATFSSASRAFPDLPLNAGLVPTVAAAPVAQQADPFATLDPFDPLRGTSTLSPSQQSSSSSSSNLKASSSFGNFASVNSATKSATPAPAPSSDSLLGNWDSLLTNPSPVSQTTTPSNFPRNASTPNFESKLRDPLADLGNLTGLQGAATTTTAATATTAAPSWGSNVKPSPPMKVGTWFFFPFISPGTNECQQLNDV